MDSEPRSYYPRWFSRHRGSNATFSTPEDFTSAFWREVLAIRQKFCLKNETFGVDIPQNINACWQAYELFDPFMDLYGEEVLVGFSRFNWGCVEPSLSEADGHLVPRFKLDMHLAVPAEQQERTDILGYPKLPSNLDIPEGCALFHSCELTIEYNSKHPYFEPRLYIADRPQEVDAHEHHWYLDGELCIYPASNTDEGWIKLGRSTVKWIGLAVAWCTWHVQEFGY